jgi:hypothetical protein
MVAGCAAAVLTPPPARDPVTAARAAAARVMGDFAARRYADAWQMLTPADQRAVPEATWVAVYGGCQHAPLAYAAGTPALSAGGTAAGVPVTVAGYPVLVDFAYDGGRWRYHPASLSMFAAGTVAADIAADRAAGICP